MANRTDYERLPLKAAVGREVRLLWELVLFVWDFSTIRFRRWRPYHELFHTSCQTDDFGREESYCRPSGKYVFKGTLPWICPNLDITSGIELYGRQIHFRCKRPRFDWKLNHGVAIALALLMAAATLAAAGFAGKAYGRKVFADLRPFAGTVIDKVKAVLGQQDDPWNQGEDAAAPLSDDGATFNGEQVPFGPLSPAWFDRNAVFGPLKPPAGK